MITPFTKVLVGTDFSEPAARAVERAVDVARRYEAALHIVHVWEVPLIAGGMALAPGIDWITPIEQAARAQLDELVEGLRSGKVDVAATLCSGVAWERIVALTEQHRADLVVVGTHGRTGLSRALLGSIAERVVRLSTVPVLTIH
jgi:nucleotide-binding universal stress UspA family protein